MHAACLVWPATQAPVFQLGMTGDWAEPRTFSCHLAHCSDQIRGGWGHRDKARGTRRYSSFLERSHPALRCLSQAESLSTCLFLPFHLATEGVLLLYQGPRSLVFSALGHLVGTKPVHFQSDNGESGRGFLEVGTR